MTGSDRPAEPQVAAWLFNGLRAELIEQGRWEELERVLVERDPALASWLERSEREQWLPLLPYFEVMAALEQRLGSDGMEQLGRERLRVDLERGALAPMLRAWIREFSDDPTALMRVSPHVWSAITQNAGVMRLVEARPGRVVFRIAGAPRELLNATGWHRLFEGFGVELIRRSGRQGSVSVVPVPDEDELELSGVWS